MFDTSELLVQRHSFTGDHFFRQVHPRRRLLSDPVKSNQILREHHCCVPGRRLLRTSKAQRMEAIRAVSGSPAKSFSASAALSPSTCCFVSFRVCDVQFIVPFRFRAVSVHQTSVGVGPEAEGNQRLDALSSCRSVQRPCCTAHSTGCELSVFICTQHATLCRA